MRLMDDLGSMTTRVIVPSSLDSLGEDDRRGRRNAMIVSTFMAAFLTAFTVAQFVGYRVWGEPTLLNPTCARIAVAANVVLIATFVAFLAVNFLAARVGWNVRTVFARTVHVTLGTALVVWLMHIHFAGSQNTLLALLIPATSYVVIWMLGSKWGWFYYVTGTTAWLVLVTLEAADLLPYFPLTSIESDWADLFLDPRYVSLNILLYLSASLVPMLFLQIFHSQLARRTHELEVARREREVAASTDSLTGALLRRAMEPLFDREIARAERRGHPLSAVVLDLDRFKSVNDTYGHGVGDRVLRGLAETARQVLRPYDLFGRMGGEEFLIVLPHDAIEDARALAERLRAKLESTPIAAGDGRTLRVTASFGVATRGAGSGATREDLIAEADARLYEAKGAGRNRVCG
ncbi:MAG: GGDEF domain-containing protein [Deltaproteobacteria bacterium]|nr:GGDEF domain-containing protein [Deltaproteobacteria bacterium]